MGAPATAPENDSSVEDDDWRRLAPTTRALDSASVLGCCSTVLGEAERDDDDDDDDCLPAAAVLHGGAMDASNSLTMPMHVKRF